MKRTELVYMDAKSSKFWNIQVEGAEHVVTFGRIGTDGQSTRKSFGSPALAEAAYEKLVKEKLGKGYVQAAGSGVKSGAAGSANGDEIPLIAFLSILRKEEIHENVKTFLGRRVADFDPEKGAKAGGETVYRFRSDWDSEGSVAENLQSFLESPAALDAVGLIIGAWHGDDPEMDSSGVIQLIAANAARLPKLAGIYIGDMTSEENEISWIKQSDLSPLLKALPDLQLLRARGGDGLALAEPKHEKLRALALEAGGLPVEVVRSIGAASFPNLEHLELWLGTDEYGGDSTVQDLQPILSGRLFPKLRYLGLRNCHYVDDIAPVIVNSPVIDQLEMLDLSLGTLTDAGAQALLSLPTGGTLKRVNLHHHFMSAGMVKKLKAMPIAFDTSNPEHHRDDDDDEEMRFVAVGE